MSNVSVGQFGLLQVDDTSDILHQCCFVSGCLCHGLTNGVYTVSPSVEFAACAVCKVVEASAFGCSRERIATGSVDLPTVGLDSKLTVPSHLLGLLSQSLLSLARGSSVLETASVLWLPMRMLLPVFCSRAVLFSSSILFVLAFPILWPRTIRCFCLSFNSPDSDAVWKLPGAWTNFGSREIQLTGWSFRCPCYGGVNVQCSWWINLQGSVRAAMTRFDTPTINLSMFCLCLAVGRKKSSTIWKLLGGARSKAGSPWLPRINCPQAMPGFENFLERRKQRLDARTFHLGYFTCAWAMIVREGLLWIFHVSRCPCSNA